ncbi:hypothetical protein ACQUSR_26630 [Streptomyces sp. P1-3]|uniref:hypothetical protein n=1 Tax=Streptomyces sp. P1-3 TaxID=3421658 RepID=UPI003D35D80E
MRQSQDPSSEYQQRSATPIYDALYAEYRRLFRALPGDRTGDEELGFTGFEALGSGTGQLAWRRQEVARPSPEDRSPERPYRGGYRPALPPAPRDGRARGF